MSYWWHSGTPATLRLHPITSKEHPTKIAISTLALALISFAAAASEKPAESADKQAWCRHVHARVLEVNPAPGKEFIAKCSLSGRSVDYFRCVDRAMDQGDEYASAGHSCGVKHP